MAVFVGPVREREGGLVVLGGPVPVVLGDVDEELRHGRRGGSPSAGGFFHECPAEHAGFYFDCV